MYVGPFCILYNIIVGFWRKLLDFDYGFLYNKGMKFDDEFLASVGLKMMPESQKEGFLKYVQEEVEVRVGEKVCEGLSDKEVAELEACADGEETLDWLRVNRPNFREMIDEVVDSVKEAIVKNAERILAGN